MTESEAKEAVALYESIAADKKELALFASIRENGSSVRIFFKGKYNGYSSADMKEKSISCGNGNLHKHPVSAFLLEHFERVLTERIAASERRLAQLGCQKPECRE